MITSAYTHEVARVMAEIDRQTSGHVVYGKPGPDGMALGHWVPGTRTLVRMFDPIENMRAAVRAQMASHHTFGWGARGFDFGPRIGADWGWSEIEWPVYHSEGDLRFNSNSPTGLEALWRGRWVEYRPMLELGEPHPVRGYMQPGEYARSADGSRAR